MITTIINILVMVLLAVVVISILGLAIFICIVCRIVKQSKKEIALKKLIEAKALLDDIPESQWLAFDEIICYVKHLIEMERG